jgi:hypothetical protein
VDPKKLETTDQGGLAQPTLAVDEFKEEEVAKLGTKDSEGSVQIGSQDVSADGIEIENTDEDEWSPIDPAA